MVMVMVMMGGKRTDGRIWVATALQARGWYKTKRSLLHGDSRSCILQVRWVVYCRWQISPYRPFVIADKEIANTTITTVTSIAAEVSIVSRSLSSAKEGARGGMAKLVSVRVLVPVPVPVPVPVE